MNNPYIYEIEGEYFTALARAVEYLGFKTNNSISKWLITNDGESKVYVYLDGNLMQRIIKRHKLNKDY